MGDSNAGRRTASVISEVFGPAVLLLVCTLEIGLRGGAVLATVIAAMSMAILPYFATILLARRGKVSDRFIANRRQRTPILLGTLAVYAVGIALLFAVGAPTALRNLALVGVGGLIVVTVITAWWKISVHATIATFFAGVQLVIFGPVGAVAVVVPAVTIWARRRLRVHTVAQLVAGAALGAVLAVVYALTLSR